MRTRTKYALLGTVLAPLAAVFGLGALVVISLVLSQLVTPAGTAILLFLSITAGAGWFIGRSRGVQAERRAAGRHEPMRLRRRYTVQRPAPGAQAWRSGPSALGGSKPERRPRTMSEIADDLFRDNA